MRATFLYAMRGHRFSLLGWAVGLFALTLLIAYLYVSFVSEQAEQLEELLDGLPKSLITFAKLEDVTSPVGFLDARFFALMPILLGIYAALAGSAILVQDEEMGRMDLFLAHPVSRRDVFLGRVLAYFLVLAIILLVGWVGLVVGIHWQNIDVSVWLLVPAFVSLLAATVSIASLALLFSMVLPSRRYAAMAALVVLVTSYFLNGFARVDPELKTLSSLLPLHYYQGADAMKGIDYVWLGVLGSVSAVCVGLAYWRFQRRDIRVAGEGSLAWHKLALGITAVVVVFAVPVVLAMIPPTYDTPEEAFAACTKAMQDEDWDAFVRTLTPDAVDEWNAMMVAYGSVTITKGKGILPQPGAIPDNVSTEKAMVLFAMMSKFRGAMKLVETDKLNEHNATIQRTLLTTMLGIGSSKVDDEQRALAKLVTNPTKFLGKSLRAWSIAFHYPQTVTLENVHIDGNSATAEMLVGSTRYEITFAKIDGSWRVGMPFLRGQWRSLEDVNGQ